MEQIIKDLVVALDKMNAKADEFAKKSAELDCLIADAKKQKVDLDKRDEFILDKESKYAEYDSLEAIRSEIKAEKVAIAKERVALDVEKKALCNEKISFDASKKNLDTMITLYKQKAADCDAAMKKLEEDRKTLEKKVIEDLTKKLTK